MPTANASARTSVAGEIIGKKLFKSENSSSPTRKTCKESTMLGWFLRDTPIRAFGLNEFPSTIAGFHGQTLLTRNQTNEACKDQIDTSRYALRMLNVYW